MRLRIKGLEQERPVILSLCGLELTIDGMEKEEVISIVADDRGVAIDDRIVDAEQPQTEAIHEPTSSERSVVTSVENVSSDIIPVDTIHPLPVPTIPSTISDDGLFRELTALRKRLAIEQNVPPYVIFNDKSLREMIEKLPQDLTSFGSINGVGKSKLERYGRIFIDTIQAYKGSIAS